MSFKQLNPVLLLVTILVLTVSCQPGVGDGPEPHEPSLLLKTGDTIVTHYTGPGAQPSFTTRVAVDGTVSVPPTEIGAVMAQGKTIQQLESDLQTAINAYYKQLKVTIQDVRFIYISGQVNAEGKIQNQEDLTLLKAITAARGLRNFADRNRVKLIREGDIYYLSINRAEDNPIYDYRIYPGDQLIVERRNF